MKKYFAILLALVLALAMSTSAMAASITITPPTGYENDNPLTYTAYKIFDATISGDNVSYTIDSINNPFYATVAAETTYFTLSQVPGATGKYLVTATDLYKNNANGEVETFAKKLAALDSKGKGYSLTYDTTNKNYTKTGLAEGYYLIISSAGTKLILDTTQTDAIEEKNSYPTIDKQAPATADKGSEVEFTITVTIPANASGEIIVHDKMTGLEYVVNSTSVTAKETGNVNAEETTITCNVTKDPKQDGSNASEGCSVHFRLSAETVAANLGKTVTITYKAKITADIANNEAWLVDDSYTSKRISTETLYTSIEIDKYVSGGETTKLPGAKFVLKNSAGKYYKIDGDVVSWVDTQEGATVVTTDANGAATLAGLANGTYELVETEAPAGYNLLTASVQVTVTAVKDENKTPVVVKAIPAKVANSSGSELPSTGGMGTTVFYVVGGMMVCAALVLLVAKKKTSYSR